MVILDLVSDLIKSRIISPMDVLLFWLWIDNQRKICSLSAIPDPDSDPLVKSGIVTPLMRKVYEDALYPP